MKTLILSCLVWAGPHGWVDTCAPLVVRCSYQRVTYRDYETDVTLLVTPSDDIYEKIKVINNLKKNSYILTVEPVCEYWNPKQGAR